jgi:hypothetical protein
LKAGWVQSEISDSGKEDGDGGGTAEADGFAILAKDESHSMEGENNNGY